MVGPSEQEKIVFSEAIERVAFEKETNYLDAILLYCEEANLEELVAATLITNSLKSKIQEQAQELHQLKTKVNRLPL